MNDNEVAEYDSKYLPGLKNRFARYYFYLNRGLDILNQFRNLFLGILGIYIALHLTNPALLAIMGVPALLILTVAGYYSVHHMSKITEWLTIRFSSHYAIKTFNYTEEQVKLLKEIKELLEHADHKAEKVG